MIEKNKTRIIIFIALLVTISSICYGFFINKVEAQKEGKCMGELIVFEKDLEDRYGDKYDVHVIYDFQKGTVSRVKVYKGICGSKCLVVEESKPYTK